MEKRLIKLYFSILTACLTGVGIALFALLLINHSKTLLISASDFLKNTGTGREYISKANADIVEIEFKEDEATENTALLEEGDHDPTFISRFSRGVIYSADDGREIIESAKNSLPKSRNIKVTAKSYVVIDLDRDVTVIEKDADRLMPIASLTKLVTAAVARKLMKENDSITVTAKALSTYGNEARLRAGEKFTLKEILYPLLMVSSNDSAEIIAQHYGREDFMEEMNAFASKVGAYRTYFKDPSGLSPQNVSTSNDLAIITKWILKNDPDIFDITLEKSKTIRTHTWTNPTHLLNLDSYDGGKNGYTPEADRTSIALFELGKQKRSFGVIFLGSSSRDSDMLDLLEEAVR